MIDRRIKCRHIRCYVEIRRKRGHRAAAENLNLTPSAISETIKELEEIFGVALIERNKSGVRQARQDDVFLESAQMSHVALRQERAR